MYEKLLSVLSVLLDIPEADLNQSIETLFSKFEIEEILEILEYEYIELNFDTLTMNLLQIKIMKSCEDPDVVEYLESWGLYDLLEIVNGKISFTDYAKGGDLVPPEKTILFELEKILNE